ncbi:hypothetical protein [Stackebrandtia soli]|uniref:hypothetical protein n=1 Tax=Stackebrandtia soli TaxID=1892856 RepID=UPI0039E8B8F2
MSLLSSIPRPRRGGAVTTAPAPGLLAATAELRRAVDGFADAYNLFHPTTITAEAARQVFADLPAIHKHIDTLEAKLRGGA